MNGKAGLLDKIFTFFLFFQIGTSCNTGGVSGAVSGRFHGCCNVMIA